MMKRFLLLLLAAAWPLFAMAQEVDFDRYFTDATLRLDYVFCGDASHQSVYLRALSRTGEWAGRRHHLADPLLEGNGQIAVLEPATGNVLYCNSFSTLFQEWQSTEEAKRVPRAYENCFQVPFPKAPVDIEIVLFDIHGEEAAYLRHPVDPQDMLIRRQQEGSNPVRVLTDGGSLAETIDIVILSEGYTAGQKRKFFADANRACDALFSHEPFASRKDDFSVRAVFAASHDAGPSIPHDGRWHGTVADSHFDTFYSERYLTTSSVRKVWDAIGNVPFEHIIVLVNTPVYGGGGIYNSLTIMGTDHPTFAPVLVHEFGHAFAGLADEYAYGDNENIYPADTEPWEPNITTLKDFAAKWQDLLPAGTPVPTPVDAIETQQDVRRIWDLLTPEQKASLNLKLGVYEGAGYQMTGVYRPVQECRMRINECEEFCPVCTRAINATIDYYTEPDLGWLFLGEGPYTLQTRVAAVPGPAEIVLVTDLSLMAPEPEEVLRTQAVVGEGGALTVPLGELAPGFYEVRLRDTLRWNIGVRPEDVVSKIDAHADFEDFWKAAFAELDTVPMEVEMTPVPEHSNELRTGYEVRFKSLGGATAGGIIMIPNAPGKYPVRVQYMGYGADVYWFDPSAHPDRIDFLVSVRDQGIFKAGQERWIDRGLTSREEFYYRGAFCDARRALDFVFSLEQTDPERVVAMGESQGGALTVAAAAWEPRLKAVSLAVPFLGDYPDYARIVFWPVHEVWETAQAEGLDRAAVMDMLTYFDTKNLAPYVTCPVIMAFGLQDPTCPPHTNFAIYNNLGTQDRRYICIPTCGHAMWKEAAWPPVRDAFFEEKL